MTAFSNKVDFIVLVQVNHANPNGDPLNDNRPRETNDGYGEISDVCIKRKIRNRWQDLGKKVFIQSDEHKHDDFKSLQARWNSFLDNCKSDPDKKALTSDDEGKKKLALGEWLDIRSFGQMFAFNKGESIGIRGPVSIHPAFSVSLINPTLTKITKCTNGVDKDGRASDTFGDKHRVDHAIYMIKGSISPQLTELTKFSEEDAEDLKVALATLFENDESSARPSGSMEVLNFYWFRHNNKSGQYSSAIVHKSIEVKVRESAEGQPKSEKDYKVIIKQLDGLDIHKVQYSTTNEIEEYTSEDEEQRVAWNEDQIEKISINE